MTLWNIIRDWFVVQIFGGYTSSGQLITSNLIGNVTAYENGVVDDNFNITNHEVYFNIGAKNVNADLWLSMGDWLSTTATIIVLCAMCFFLFLVVRWLFRLTSGLLSGRG